MSFLFINLLELNVFKGCDVSCIVVGHFHRDGQEGIVTLLENFSQEDYMIAIYESGKGIRRISAKELIGERK